MSTKMKGGRPKKYEGTTKVYSHRVPEVKYNEVKDIVDKIIAKILNGSYSVDKKKQNPLIKIFADGIKEFNKLLKYNTEKGSLLFPDFIKQEKILGAIKECQTITN